MFSTFFGPLDGDDLRIDSAFVHPRKCWNDFGFHDDSGAYSKRAVE